MYFRVLFLTTALLASAPSAYAQEKLEDCETEGMQIAAGDHKMVFGITACGKGNEADSVKLEMNVDSPSGARKRLDGGPIGLSIGFDLKRGLFIDIRDGKKREASPD